MKENINELLSVAVDDLVPQTIIDSYRKRTGLFGTPVFAAISLANLQPLVTSSGGEAVAVFFLTTGEHERYKSYRFPKRKLEWLGGRIAAKHAAAGFCGWANAWHDWQIVSDAHGKPFIKLLCQDGGKQPSLHISIAHSGNLAVAMAADGDCGIDIQLMTDTVVRVRERFAGLNETLLFTNISGHESPDEKMRLALLWTAKEAIRKAVPVSPLLGFKEMHLERINVERQGGYILNFVVQPDIERKGETVIPGMITTAAFLVKDYAVAFTVCP